MMSICIGSNKSDEQLSIPTKAVKLNHNYDKSRNSSLDATKKGKACIFSVRELSEVLENHLLVDCDGKDQQSDSVKSPVILFESEDSHLLRCARPVGFDQQETASILGILENQSLFRGRRGGVAQDEIKEEEDLTLHLEVLRPDISETLVDFSKVEGCSCKHPKSDWTRRPRKIMTDMNHTDSEDKALPDAYMKIYDLTDLQSQRKSGILDFRLDTKESICHLLRSTLKCSNNDVHCASPWSEYCTATSPSTSNVDTCLQSDQLFGILLRNHAVLDEQLNSSENEEDSWNTLEKNEIIELVKIRTGDLCPSYYLYSVSNLRTDFVAEMFGNQKNIYNGADNGITLLVYRHLPLRRHFYDHIDCEEVDLHPGCLIEEMRIVGEDPDLAQKQYRVVAPPYQNHEDIYMDQLKNIFLNPENLEIVINEAESIPQWTAWPERNHYQSDYDNDTEVTNSAYPASWTVFPLCHTFPASDVSARKWIPKTCAFVPQTTLLLKELGPVLRTALFSRIEPHTTLGSHTGWADLANHVLRVHIPLVVPSNGTNNGLCGTWVDGCVETHEKGNIICFDDSKTHRAFNYTNKERIVLIVDLARPTDQGFPEGTASGGHTNELDSFIKHFS